MKIYRGKFISDVYRSILTELLYNPEYISNPRGMEVKEIINCTLEISNPCANMYTNKYRSSVKNYVSAELLWYFSGTNNIDFISNYASMWKHLTNEDGTVNSAYGNLIFTEKNNYGISQYEWVIETLKRDKDSRQAIMHFNKPNHQFFENKDQVCTLTALFHIRNNKLNMTLNMRSNDVILGFMTDYTFFNILHQQVYTHLKMYYPELEMGYYNHTSHSMHLYSKHYELVEKMLSEPFYADSTPLLTTSIINEKGSFKEKYKELFEQILYNKPITIEKTDNELINWALEHIKN
ncbi:thymidylate synthase [bacterium]|jgi:thymidylate synthase|nr:thymidylate synthase [bacterium]